MAGSFSAKFRKCFDDNLENIDASYKHTDGETTMFEVKRSSIQTVLNPAK